MFNTRKLLNRAPSVLLGQNSGLAGIAYWINNTYNLPESEQVDKKDPVVLAMKEWIDQEYAGGRVSTLSLHEIEEKIHEVSGGRFGQK